MASRKDYYEILGVPKTASDKEIKAAYRRLARKHHPDLNKGDKGAEERFKEVAEAFAVLHDKDKRAKYDSGGHEAFGAGFDPFSGADAGEFDFGSGNLADLFEMFGMGSGRGPRRGARRAGPRRGANTRMDVRVPFLDAVRGGTLELVIPRPSACEACGGTGVRAGDPCPVCGGTGSKTVEERARVRIPPGIEDGGTLRLEGKGESGPGGSGDAFLTVHVEPHPVFKRQGQDLVSDVSVGLARAALGGPVEVTTPDGQATITLPPGTRSGQKFRLKGRGVQASRGKPAGDLYARIQIHPPKQLDDRSRELMEEFARLNPVP